MIQHMYCLMEFSKMTFPIHSACRYNNQTMRYHVILSQYFPFALSLVSLLAMIYFLFLIFAALAA